MSSIHSIFDSVKDPAYVSAMQKIISKTDAIAFAFPWWWEMPPYPMVEFLQKVFVKDFAFTHDTDGRKTKLLNKPAQLIICAGQDKQQIQIEPLVMAMEYCGLHADTPLIFTGCKPGLAEETVDYYSQTAFKQGRLFFS